MSDNKNPAPYSCATSGCLHDILATRLAAAESEPLDATIADLAIRLGVAEAERDILKQGIMAMHLCVSDAQKEGERRATAAIVAWLRDDAADGKTQFQLARAIRRGDPLKGTSNE